MARAWVILIEVVLLAIACSKPAATPEKEKAAVARAADAGPWQPDRSCAADEECVPAASCCPVPCTSNVINRKDAERDRVETEARCATRLIDCPSAGSCPGHAYICLRGACALVMEGDKDYRERR